MPYRRDDSPIWWASFTDAKGRRVRRSTGTTDRREADALEAKWKLEAHQAKQWGADVTHTFEDLMTDYLQARKDEIVMEPVILSIKRLRTMFAGRAMGGLKRADISAYILKRKGEGVGPATINRDLDVLSAAINYAVRRWDWDIPNPTAGMSESPRVSWRPFGLSQATGAASLASCR